MPKHVYEIWGISKIGQYPQCYVETSMDTKNIHLDFFIEKDKSGACVSISRRKARMLAKRINQCLDASK